MRKSLLLIISITTTFSTLVSAENTTQHFDSYAHPLLFGPDQTIVDINKTQWQPLHVAGLPKGAEITVLRGNPETGFSESLLRLTAGYKLPMHKHTSDEVYVWLYKAHLRCFLSIMHLFSSMDLLIYLLRSRIPHL